MRGLIPDDFVDGACTADGVLLVVVAEQLPVFVAETGILEAAVAQTGDDGFGVLGSLVISGISTE